MGESSGPKTMLFLIKANAQVQGIPNIIDANHFNKTV